MSPRRPRRRHAPNRPIDLTATQTFTSFLDGLPFGVMVLTEGRLIRGINSEGARLLGQSQPALIGQSFPTIWSILTQLKAAEVLRRLDSVSTSREPMPHTKTRLRYEAGGSVPVEWTCQGMDQEEGRGLLVSLRDLSREEGLREERDRLAASA